MKNRWLLLVTIYEDRQAIIQRYDTLKFSENTKWTTITLLVPNRQYKGLYLPVLTKSDSRDVDKFLLLQKGLDDFDEDERREWPIIPDQQMVLEVAHEDLSGRIVFSHRL